MVAAAERFENIAKNFFSKKQIDGVSVSYGTVEYHTPPEELVKTIRSKVGERKSKLFKIGKNCPNEYSFSDGKQKYQAERDQELEKILNDLVAILPPQIISDFNCVYISKENKTSDLGQQVIMDVLFTISAYRQKKIKIEKTKKILIGTKNESNSVVEVLGKKFEMRRDNNTDTSMKLTKNEFILVTKEGDHDDITIKQINEPTLIIVGVEVIEGEVARRGKYFFEWVVGCCYLNSNLNFIIPIKLFVFSFQPILSITFSNQQKLQQKHVNNYFIERLNEVARRKISKIDDIPLNCTFSGGDINVTPRNSPLYLGVAINSHPESCKKYLGTKHKQHAGETWDHYKTRKIYERAPKDGPLRDDG